MTALCHVIDGRNTDPIHQTQVFGVLSVDNCLFTSRQTHPGMYVEHTEPVICFVHLNWYSRVAKCMFLNFCKVYVNLFILSFTLCDQ